MLVAVHSKGFPPKSIEKYSALNAVLSKDSSSSPNNSVATRYEKTALNFLAGLQLVCAPAQGRTRLRIPTKPAMHSKTKPATYSDLKPASPGSLPRIGAMMFRGGGSVKRPRILGCEEREGWSVLQGGLGGGGQSGRSGPST